ncbi:hypothetical protein CAI21_22235 [Alkalilimnicola ehrlichii]|uniref:Uncharacterized protein n=1 Tax=Alkalilimnicola ehrlichii TaxID=351052 RepID=A0A3E0WFL7_9GAMM|nr:hypothetical protein [Alkalilimnicola ehrlichii]RFA24290.1 hypothetical protein CAI21_22235 [Alkalilimnicola ehrlichii]RFA31528.1 hypothetical protein CAL65_22405 [Alkalilimnicola ehrlichii]
MPLFTGCHAVVNLIRRPSGVERGEWLGCRERGEQTAGEVDAADIGLPDVPSQLLQRLRRIDSALGARDALKSRSYNLPRLPWALCLPPRLWHYYQILP